MKRIFSILLSVVLIFGLIIGNAIPVSAAADFVISDECVELLKSMEGFDKYPRWDYSQWTVGHGTRCPDEDLERYREHGITYEEADALLRKYANTFAKSINSFLNKFNLDYTQQQFDALLLFTYNFGPAWMFRENSSWRNGLINGVTGNDFMFEIGQWCHAGGQLLRPLIVRRLIEANIFFNGIYSRTAPDNYCYVIFEFNGGEGETEVQAYDSNLDAPIRVIPTREGYTFVGWYTANQGGKKITELDRSTKNMTLYARWVEGENVDIGELPEEEEAPETPQPVDPVKVTVNANGVNIRSGPGTDYSVVDVVYAGRTMTITEVQTRTGYTWGKFGEDRWIALVFTDYDELVNQKPEEEDPDEPTEPPVEPTDPPTQPTEPPVEPTEPPVEPTEPPTQPTEPPVVPTDPPTQPTEPPVEPTDPPTQPTEPPTQPTEPPVEEEPEQTGVMGTVTGSDLRIRTGAGTNYEVIGFLQIGDRITVTERKMVGSMEWGKMESGWVSLTYVKLDEPAPEEKPEEKPEEEPEEPETEPSEPEETDPVVMTGWVDVNDFLRIRKGPGLDYSVVGYYGPDDFVTIYETEDADDMTWGRTDKGWISLDYVILDEENDEPETEEPEEEESETEEPETESNVITGTVDVDDCLRIRIGPGTDYYIVGFLDPGDRVTITETTVVDGMTWGKISEGWISMDYVIVD